MDSRERVARALSGRDHDRVPYQDVFWKSTIQRWRREGLPADVDLAEYFDCEIARIGGDYSLQFPKRMLEETPRYRIYVDADGPIPRDYRRIPYTRVQRPIWPLDEHTEPGLIL